MIKGTNNIVKEINRSNCIVASFALFNQSCCCIPTPICFSPYPVSWSVNSKNVIPPSFPRRKWMCCASAFFLYSKHNLVFFFIPMHVTLFFCFSPMSFFLIPSIHTTQKQNTCSRVIQLIHTWQQLYSIIVARYTFIVPRYFQHLQVNFMLQTCHDSCPSWMISPVAKFLLSSPICAKLLSYESWADLTMYTSIWLSKHYKNDTNMTKK
jgi:hypothetical protein